MEAYFVVIPKIELGKWRLILLSFLRVSWVSGGLFCCHS